MQYRRLKRTGALLVGLTLVVAACGDDDDDDGAVATAETEQATEEATGDTTAPAATEPADTEPAATEPADTEPAATEPSATEPSATEPAGAAECGNATSDVTDGALSGFAGTTPFGVVTDEFISRLCEVDPSLTDLNYASETYDAVMIVALAVEAAGDDGIAHACEMDGITRDGEKCTTFADCKALIEAGTDIDYDGISGPLTFAGNGEPIVASYGLLKMGDNNRIDITQTEYISVEGPPEADVPLTPVEGNRARRRRADARHAPAADGVAGLPRTTRVRRLRPGDRRDQRRAAACSAQTVVGIAGDSGDTTTNQADQTTTGCCRRTST